MGCIFFQPLKIEGILSGDLLWMSCVRPGFRLVNTKCMMLVDMWKKIQHSNSVTLREVFTTKAFGDHCESCVCVWGGSLCPAPPMFFVYLLVFV